MTDPANPQRATLTTQERSARYRGASPWRLRHRMGMLLWDLVWALACSWTPKPMNRWRLIWLRFFGATVEGTPFVHQRARIHIPWNITLGAASCVGDRANLYSLDRIEVGAGAIVAQEAYLCTGTHDVTHPSFPLQTAPIRIGEGAFVGARAFVLPGMEIGRRSVVGACSVVTRPVPDGIAVAGNPARPICHRAGG